MSRPLCRLHGCTKRISTGYVGDSGYCSETHRTANEVVGLFERAVQYADPRGDDETANDVVAGFYVLLAKVAGDDHPSFGLSTLKAAANLTDGEIRAEVNA